jgi:hypothetical protein
MEQFKTSDIKIASHRDGFLLRVPEHMREQFLTWFLNLQLSGNASFPVDQRKSRLRPSGSDDVELRPGLDEQELSRLFSSNPDGDWDFLAKSKVVPGLLPSILLYWHLIQQRPEVPAGVLKRDLAACGVTQRRLDRLLKNLRNDVVRRGTTKGSRYRLTAEGMRRAEDALKAVMERRTVA